MTTFRTIRSGALVLVAIITGACADAVGPTTNADVLADWSSHPPAADTSDRTPRTFNDYAGMVVEPSRDALTPWRRVAGVAIELVHVDEATKAERIVATGVTGADGTYRMTDPTKMQFWTMKIRATPPAGSGLRASILHTAYTTSSMNVDRDHLALERIDDPASPGGPVVFHGIAMDAPALGTSGPGVAGTIVSLQKVIRERRTNPMDPNSPIVRELDPHVDQGVTDAAGRFIMRVTRGAGSYIGTASAPPGYRAVADTINPYVSEQAELNRYAFPIRLEKRAN